MRGWRKMTWVLWAWCALIVYLAVAGASGSDCGGEDACEAGTGLGVLLILLVGFFGFMFFAAIWYMTRPRD